MYLEPGLAYIIIGSWAAIGGRSVEDENRECFPSPLSRLCKIRFNSLLCCVTIKLWIQHQNARIRAPPHTNETQGFAVGDLHPLLDVCSRQISRFPCDCGLLNQTTHDQRDEFCNEIAVSTAGPNIVAN